MPNRLSIFAVLFFCCYLVSSVQAQLDIGFRGGVHLAYNNLEFDIDPAQITEVESITGLTLSIPIEFPAGRMFSIQSGLSFVSKGNLLHHRESGQSYTSISKYRIDYLEIPVLSKISLRLHPFDLFLLGGVNVGYAIDLKAYRLSYDLVWLRQEYFKIDFQRAGVDRFDISMVLGGGLMAHISRGKKIFIDARYDFGFYDIDAEAGSEVFNAGRSFTMGILIPFKRPGTSK